MLPGTLTRLLAHPFTLYYFHSFTLFLSLSHSFSLVHSHFLSLSLSRGSLSVWLRPWPQPLCPREGEACSPPHPQFLDGWQPSVVPETSAPPASSCRCGPWGGCLCLCLLGHVFLWSLALELWREEGKALARWVPGPPPHQPASPHLHSAA